MISSSHVWVPGTTVTLCRVPWDSRYNNIVMWNSIESRDLWLTSLVDTVQMTMATYCRDGEPILINQSFSKVNEYNYCIVNNPSDDSFNTARELFYFVTGVRFGSPGATYLDLSLDVVQTYGQTIQLGQCLVERGHVGISNTNFWSNDNRYEAISEYLTAYEDVAPGGRLGVSLQQTMGFDWDHIVTIVMSNIDLTADPGTADAPLVATASGSVVDGIAIPTSCYVIDGDITGLAIGLSNYPWVSRSLYGIITLPIELVRLGDAGEFHAKFGGGVYNTLLGIAQPSFADIDPAEGLMIDVPPEYQNLVKLATYPYSAIELQTAEGLAPFRLQDFVALPSLMAWGVLAPPSPTIMVSLSHTSASHTVTPIEYLGKGGFPLSVTGDEIASAIPIGQVPSLSLLVDGGLLAYASGSYHRDFTMQSAAWNRTLAMTGADTAQSNAAITRNATQDSTTVANRAATEQAAYSVVGQAGGAIGSLATGNIGGAVSGVIGAATTVASTGAANAARLQQAAISMSANEQQSNNNYSLATLGADTGYKSALASVAADIATAEMSPPSTVGGSSGLLPLATGLFAITLKYRSLMRGDMRRVGDFFLRWGYAINRYMTPPSNLKVMEKFSYWKMGDVVITDMIGTEYHRNIMTGVLRSGVTVFSHPDDINNINIYDNEMSNNYGY